MLSNSNLQKQIAYGQYTLCCNNTHTIKNLNNPSFLLYIYKEKYATSKVATKYI